MPSGVPIGPAPCGLTLPIIPWHTAEHCELNQIRGKGWDGAALKCTISAEHREFEAALKKRRSQFADLLDRCQSEVDKYDQRGELSKRDEIAAQATVLLEQLKQVSHQPGRFLDALWVFFVQDYICQSG